MFVFNCRYFIVCDNGLVVRLQFKPQIQHFRMGKIIENYSLQQELGSGVYSKVYKAINLKTKQQVAIKCVKAQKFKELPKLEEGTVNQINILTNLEYCPHIIRYFDMLKTVNNFYFVYEFCNGGTFQSLLKKQGPLPQKTALNYFSQIVDAFKVLNKNNIMHRDLKPDNILIHEGVLKLADFGFCKPLESEGQTTKTMLGSPIYMAPEILKGESYTIKADIWSLGVVLFRMLYGYCPFESNNIGQLIMKIDKQQMVIPSEPYVSPKLVNLLKKMLTKNPNFRADWSEIFSHQIKNGEIINSGIMKFHKNLTDSGNKSTITPTSQSSGSSKIQYNSTFTNSTKDLVKGKTQDRFGTYSQANNNGIDKGFKPQIKADLMYNPRDPQLRSTYTTKSPLRQNIKKDLMLKNHSKCIDLASIVTSLCRYECNDSLVLAYLFAVNLEKELNGIMDSMRKQGDIRFIEDPFIKNCFQMVEVQLGDIRGNIQIFQEEIRSSLQVNPESLESRRRGYLKRFIGSCRYQNSLELVLVSRVLDLMEDNPLFIRRETYQKMSKEQLAKKIKDKIQTLNDF